MNNLALNPPLIGVKLAPGHEDDEKLLERTDIPAMGWPNRVYRDGNVLKADIEQVPDIVADLIRNGSYKKISAEIFPDFCYAGQCYGPTLRRIGVLGGELPAVKSLADIPTPANGKIKGLEIFAAGTHGDRTWTTADLDRVCENFDRLSRGRAAGAIHSERCRPGRLCTIFSENRSMCSPTVRNREVAKVKAFYSSPQMAVALKAAGSTVAEKVAKFSEFQRRDPTVTAVKYGVPATFADDAANVSAAGPDLTTADAGSVAGIVKQHTDAIDTISQVIDDWSAAVAVAKKLKSPIALSALSDMADGVGEAVAQVIQQLHTDPGPDADPAAAGDLSQPSMAAAMSEAGRLYDKHAQSFQTMGKTRQQFLHTFSETARREKSTIKALRMIGLAPAA